MNKENNVLFVSEASKAAMRRLNYPLGIRALFDPQAVIELEQKEREENRRFDERMKALRATYGDEVPF